MPSDDLAALGDELTGLSRRIAELRSARRLPGDQRGLALDAALPDLDEAVRRLWAQHRALLDEPGRAAQHGTREAGLLRALFQSLPLPVLLLDPDAVVRRLNPAAAGLLGAGPGYATGRPLTGAVSPAHRAVLRSQVAAVARTGESRSVLVEFSAGTGPAQLQMTLVAVRPHGESCDAVLAVVQTAGRLPSEPRGRLKQAGARPAVEDAARETLHLDLLDAMTTALLESDSADPASALRQAARVLHGRTADWVIGDLLDVSGTRRAAVLGPGGADGDELTTALLKQLPDDCPLVVSTLETRTSVVQLHPEDLEGFGHDQEGAAMLARARVTSLVCLPLCSAPPGAHARPVRGVLTLLRTGGREPFALAEVAVLDRLSRHMALRLERAHRASGAGP